METGQAPYPEQNGRFAVLSGMGGGIIGRNSAKLKLATLPVVLHGEFRKNYSDGCSAFS